MNSYSSYKNSGVEWIGQIPSAWKINPIGLNFDINGRIGWKNLRSDEYVDEPNYIFLSTPNLKSKNIDYENVNYITKERYDESPEIKLSVGDILLVKSGSTLGIVNIVRHLPKPASVNGSSVVLRKQTDNINPNYYYHLLKSNYFQNIMKITQSGVGVPSVNQSDIKKIKILLPSNQEQQQISDYLDYKTSKIDTLIKTTQQKIDLLKEQRISLINTSVTKGLNPNKEMKDSGVEWIGEIPNGWDIKKFKYVSEIVTGNTPSKKNEELFYTNADDGFVWVKPSSLDNGHNYINSSEEYLTNEGRDETRVIPKDSTMICCIGNTSGKHGISGQELSTNQQINSVLPNKNILKPRFCLFYVSMFTNDLLKWINFATLPIFTKTNLEDTIFILPPLQEQKQIVDYLDKETSKIDSLINIESRRIVLLKEFRQSLVSDVVTGKVDVRNEALA
jgi:type I restriction enzyme, S subunit